MFRFAHPEYLYLLLLIPVLIGVFIYTKIQRRRNITKFGNPDLLADLMPNVSYIRPQVKFYLQLIVEHTVYINLHIFILLCLYLEDDPQKFLDLLSC